MMNPRILLSIVLSLLTAGLQATTGFRLMDAAEAERHRQAMAGLQGAEREAYRNRVWAELRERARAQGYAMPETPPWIQAAPPASGSVEQPREPATTEATSPTGEKPTGSEPPTVDAEKTRAVPPTTADNARKPPEAGEAASPAQAPTPDLPALVDKHRRVIENAAAAQAKRSRTTPPTTAESLATRAYREQMRRRFAAFMAQREAHRRQLQSQHARQTTPPAPTLPAWPTTPTPPAPWGMPPHPPMAPPAPAWSMPPAQPPSQPRWSPPMPHGQGSMAPRPPYWY